LSKHPVDGFSAGLVDDNNVFEWHVTIIGPPDTLYLMMNRKYVRGLFTAQTLTR
ncbi:hypothetical protein ACJX0J_033084, partial [Zea mays]